MKRKYKHKRYDGTPSKRKFYGFNFYIQSNEKLSVKHRDYLLDKSRNYLGLIYNSSLLSTEEKQRKGLVNELDSFLTDLELLEIWNPIYEEFGFLIPDFKDKWESKRIPKSNCQTKYLKFEQTENEIEGLRKPIIQLEILIKKSKFVEGLG